MLDLKQKAQSRIQSFNVRVTQQDDKNDQSSNQANKQRLEAKFRSALRQMYEAFEEAYTWNNPSSSKICVTTSSNRQLHKSLVCLLVPDVTLVTAENTKLQFETGPFQHPCTTSLRLQMKPTKRLKTTKLLSSWRRQGLKPMDLPLTGSNSDCRMTTKGFALLLPVGNCFTRNFLHLTLCKITLLEVS